MVVEVWSEVRRGQMEVAVTVEVVIIHLDKVRMCEMLNHGSARLHFASGLSAAVESIPSQVK